MIPRSEDVLHYSAVDTVLVKKTGLTEIPVSVGKKVFVYDSKEDRFRVAEIVRVYDENIYRQEHYPEGIPEWDNASCNDSLVDVVIDNHIRKGYFVWGLREINP